MLLEVLQLKSGSSGELLDLSSDLNAAGGGNNIRESGMDALLISKNGNHIPLEIKFNPIINQNTSLSGMVLAFRDITARRLATEQIKLQTSRAEALVKVAEQLNSRIEFKDVLDTVCSATNQVLNASATMVFLYDPKSNLFRDMARKVDISFPKGDPGLLQVTFNRDTLQTFLSADNSPFTIPDVAIRKDIPIRHVLRLLKIHTLAVAPLIRSDNVIGILVCGSIKSDRSYSQDDLELLKGLANHVTIAISNASMFEQVRSGRERQRKLAKGLIEVQETERRNIARDLHDHFGQSLTGLQFMLESIKNKASDVQKPQLNEIQEFVGDIIEQVRELSLNLRPSMLDDIGLLPTLKWLFERYTNQTGIKVKFQSENFIVRFPSEIETTAFRITQEALTNVARYAQVKDVFVGLALQENTLWVEVLDKGKGFDASGFNEKPTAGLGGMRERANLVGGYLAVNSYLNQGTQILAALPLTNKPIERRKNDRNNPAG
jgi:signal transduction histidine kinase